ncbi:MAG: hypothetical protein ACT4PV_13130 [Planctomycetaceae bacterium]
MTRLGLFVFLVLVIPAGAFWAGNGFSGPGDSWRLFASQTRGILGDRSSVPPPATPAQPPEPTPPEQPEATPPEPPPPPPPAVDPRVAADELFAAGKFEEAAAKFAGLDAQREAEARLGVALLRAFPRNIPEGVYLKVTTLEGAEWEGFAQDKGDQIQLVKPGGLSISLPRARIRSQVEVPRAEVLKRAREEVLREGADAGATGPRLFALIQQALLMGDPAAAADLLPRALEQEESTGFFLTSIRVRIPDVAAREAVFQALQACLVPRTPAAETPTVRVPDRISDGGGSPKSDKPLVNDPRAQEMMRKAAPLRERGDDLYRDVALKILQGKATDADRPTLEEALRLYTEASKLYQQVLAIEYVNSVASIDKHVARRVAQLLFERDHWGESAKER